MSKWTSEQISKFLDLYEQHELLWNTRCDEYINKAKRENAFAKLIMEIKEKLQITITIEEVRKKIKAIKTVYRNELLKILKSKKSGASVEDIYIPKLVWFKKANSFLNDVTASRQSTSNMVLKPATNTQTDSELLGDDMRKETQEVEIDDIEIEGEGTQSIQSQPITATPQHRSKTIQQLPNNFFNNNPKTSKVRGSALKRKADSHIETVKEALVSLKDIAAANNDRVEDEFVNFGKHVAAQLRQLPIINALRLQEKIQSLITTERISVLSTANNSYTTLIQEAFTEDEHSSTYSTSRSSTMLTDAIFPEYPDTPIYHDLQSPNEH